MSPGDIAAPLGLAAFGLAALYAVAFAHRPASSIKTLCKTLPVLGLAGVAALSGAPPLLAAALVISALGDAFLSRDGNRAFLSGMAFFALAHLVYILIFSTASGSGPLAAFAQHPALAILLIGLTASSELWLAPRLGPLKWPVRGYVLVIAAMGLAALTLPAHYLLVMIGAGAFIASDLMLAVDLFVARADGPLARPRAVIVWTLYFFAQALILTGLVLAG